MTSEYVETFKLGGDLEVQRLGFGTLFVTTGRGFGPPRPGAVELLQEAVRLGVNLIDTADSYGPGYAEDVVRDALYPYSGLVIATKGGFLHSTEPSWIPDGRPEHLRKVLEESLKRLRVDCIDLYQFHTPDPNIPFTESISVFKEFQQHGKIRHIGVSNVDLAQLKEACREVKVVSVQNAYNVLAQKGDDVLEYCESNNIAFIPWRPLADGRLPRSEVFRQVAEKHEVTVAQVMLAALLRRSKVILPIPGTCSIQHLRENAAAAKLSLSDEEISLLWGRKFAEGNSAE